MIPESDAFQALSSLPLAKDAEVATVSIYVPMSVISSF